MVYIWVRFPDRAQLTELSNKLNLYRYEESEF